MATSVTYEVTSERPCQIPAIGEFEAGETKVLDEVTLQQFERVFGYGIDQANFPTWVHVTTQEAAGEDTEGTEE